MIFLIFLTYLLVIGTGYWLKYLNLSYLRVHGHTVPLEFEGIINPAALRRITDYTLENNRLGLVESLFNNLLLIIFFFGGLIGRYDDWIASLTGSFVWAGCLFFIILQLAGTLLDIPFSLYKNFMIENRYGFNTMTLRLWLSDLGKSTVISVTLSTLVILTVLNIILLSPAWWWLWVWCFMLLFGVFMLYISPYVIEPLFFKFESVKAEGLEEKICSLMERAGLKVSRVFQVDASRRSRHSNAYFTGIGRVKRIILFDTLIQQMSQDEILAVLAHEIGHWKKRHILKHIIRTEVMAFCGLFLVYHLLSWQGVPHILGLSDASFYARAVIVGFLFSIAAFPFTPLSNYLSRRNEKAADQFASELTGRPDAMVSALIKLSNENLSNLHPHPLYAKVYYSHPPVVERIRDLRRQETGQGNRE